MSQLAIDVGERTSADVPRFGLRLHSVSSAIGSQQKFGAKIEEIGDFLQIAVRLLAKLHKINYFPLKNRQYDQFS